MIVTVVAQATAEQASGDQFSLIAALGFSRSCGMDLNLFQPGGRWSTSLSAIRNLAQ